MGWYYKALSLSLYCKLENLVPVLRFTTSSSLAPFRTNICSDLLCTIELLTNGQGPSPCKLSDTRAHLALWKDGPSRKGANYPSPTDMQHMGSRTAKQKHRARFPEVSKVEQVAGMLKV